MHSFMTLHHFVFKIQVIKNGTYVPLGNEKSKELKMAVQAPKVFGTFDFSRRTR